MIHFYEIGHGDCNIGGYPIFVIILHHTDIMNVGPSYVFYEWERNGNPSI
jgi:hypothetical protein